MYHAKPYFQCTVSYGQDRRIGIKNDGSLKVNVGVIAIFKMSSSGQYKVPLDGYLLDMFVFSMTFNLLRSYTPLVCFP